MKYTTFKTLDLLLPKVPHTDQMIVSLREQMEICWLNVKSRLDLLVAQNDSKTTFLKPSSLLAYEILLTATKPLLLLELQSLHWSKVFHSKFVRIPDQTSKPFNWLLVIHIASLWSTLRVDPYLVLNTENPYFFSKITRRVRV